MMHSDVEREPSAARLQRLICPNSSIYDGTLNYNIHCFHANQVMHEVTPGISEWGEVCCQCAPTWMRIVVPVKRFTQAIVDMMNKHPIYHCVEISAESQIRQQLLMP